MENLIAVILGRRLNGIARATIRDVSRRPVRSTLTALGVIVGVAALITTTSIGNGAKANIQQMLSRPDSRVVFLFALLSDTDSGRGFAKLSPNENLRVDDYRHLRQNLGPSIAVTPRIYWPGAHLQVRGQTVESVLEGFDLDGFDIVPRKLLSGALFTTVDVANAANVCVISRSLATALKVHAISEPQIVLIEGSPFSVVGIVSDNPDQVSPADLHVYAPFSSILQRLNRSADMSIAVQAPSIERVGVTQHHVERLIEEHRQGRKSIFRTSTQVASIKAYSDGSTTVARLLAAVAAISLIVGGIGIMNITLASVTERTREIGIRLALGTRSGDITALFLGEAVLLGLLGGIVGIVTGGASAWFIANLYGWAVSISPLSLIEAFLCSFGVGALFGYYPARRAAALTPVAALAYNVG